MENSLPSIPVKRYFTISEVGDLCGVKPHVLRYWEQEFTQLRPMKRRGNRRYYQHHEVLMIRRIRELLYDQGFTISGARNKMQEPGTVVHDRRHAGISGLAASKDTDGLVLGGADKVTPTPATGLHANACPHSAYELPQTLALTTDQVRQALYAIRALLE